jgi:hypothetical protein
MLTAHLTSNEILIHHDLRLLRTRLQDIYLSAASFEPMTPKPPILGTSMETNSDEDNQGGQENVPGMRILREAIKSDLERLETVSLCFGMRHVEGLIISWRPVVSGRPREHKTPSAINQFAVFDIGMERGSLCILSRGIDIQVIPCPW